MNMRPSRSEIWEKIVTAGEQAASAYEQMVAASDRLADVVAYNADYVLGHLLPKSAGERRDSKRILRWLEDRRSELEIHVQARLAEEEKAEQLQALLGRLKLTKEEQQLLGL